MTALRAATLVMAIALAASGCTDAAPEEATETSTASDPAAPTSSATQLPCDETIETGADLPPSYAAIADAIALPTADSADQALQTSQRGENPAPNYFAKTGLAVRPDVSFTIKVNGQPDAAQLGWGSPAEFDTAITTDGCTGEGWLVFAGGFLVDGPRCIDVTVTANGAEETVQVGVGAPCAGQQPPPEPSDS